MIIMRMILQIIYYLLCLLSVMLFGCTLFSFPASVKPAYLSIAGLICCLGNLIMLVVISSYKEEKPANAKPVMKHARETEEEITETEIELSELKHARNVNDDSDKSFLNIPAVRWFLQTFIEEREDAPVQPLQEEQEEEIEEEPAWVKAAEERIAQQKQAQQPQPAALQQSQPKATAKPVYEFRFNNSAGADTSTHTFTNAAEDFYAETENIELNKAGNEKQQTSLQPQKDLRPQVKPAEADKYYEPLSETQKQYIQQSDESYLNTVGMPQLRITRTLENDRLRQEISHRLMVEKEENETSEEIQPQKPAKKERLNEQSDDFDLEKYERIDSALNIAITVLIIILFGFGLFLLYRKMFG